MVQTFARDLSNQSVDQTMAMLESETENPELETRATEGTETGAIGQDRIKPENESQDDAAAAIALETTSAEAKSEEGTNSAIDAENNKKQDSTA